MNNERIVKKNIVEGKMKKKQITPNEAWIALQKLGLNEGSALSSINEWQQELGRSEYDATRIRIHKQQ